MIIRTRHSFVLALAAAVVTAVTLAAQARTALEDVLQTDLDRFAAMAKSDVAALDRLLAGELSYIDSNGRLDDKQALLYRIRSGSTTYRAIIPAERKARVVGTTAFIQGVVTMRGKERTQDVDVSARYTSVYVRRAGGWQLMAWQATRLVPPAGVIEGQSAN